MAALMVLTVFAGVASAAGHTVETRGPVWNMQVTNVTVTNQTDTYVINDSATLNNFEDWKDLADENSSELDASVDGYAYVTGYDSDGDVQIQFENVTSGDHTDLFKLVADSENFAAFWYDIDDNKASETIILDVYQTESENELGDDTDALIYNSEIQDEIETTFNFSNDGPSTYEKIGFLAEEYVPVVPGEADKLSKLAMDDDTSYTIRTGESLELADGYTLIPQQIDVDGNKVWLELNKDGEYVDDKVITVESGLNLWEFDQTVMGEDDVVTLKVNIDEVFQGQVDSLCVVEGIWQIEDDGIELESEDSFGNMEIDTVSGNTIDMILSNSITLNSDDTFNVMEDIYFTTADADELRFHLTKVMTEPGTYEVRGTVANVPDISDSSVTWTPTGASGYSFAGFWYDLADNDFSEELEVNVSGMDDDDRELDDDPSDVTYASTIVPGVETTFNFSNDGPSTFEKVGFLAEEYVPVVSGEADKLSKLAMDDDTSYTIRTGESLELADGYAIIPQQIDVEGDKVWLELQKDGEYVDDKVITVNGSDLNVWEYDQTVMGEDDVVTLKVNIDEVFQGQVDSLCVIEGVWQIEDDGIELESEDSFGNMEIDSINTDTIEMVLSSSITLSQDSTQHLMEDIYFKVADSDDVRFYPFVERTIEGEEEPAEPEEPVEPEEPEENVTEPEEPEEPVEPEEPEENVTEPEEPEEPAENETEEDQGIPGFEAVFAIAGLLAVAYLVRRN
ncbi:S-layer protein [Methanohalophilus portucalensis FDF-1]|nr:S-layer protein [Methanohalophilus portucalensis FDF-1]